MPQRPSPTFLPLAFLALTACARDGAGTASSPLPTLPTGATAAYAEEAGQWLMAPGDYANTRYSRLTEINADNVGRLQVAWTFSTGVNRGQEAAPLVVGATMYVVTPYPNILYALDLTRSGAVKWRYAPHPAAQGVACCDVVNRGAAYADGRVFFNTLDNHTIAIDAETGRELWKTRLGDIERGETMTMAPSTFIWR